jgi:hypothetical protein
MSVKRWFIRGELLAEHRPRGDGEEKHEQYGEDNQADETAHRSLKFQISNFKFQIANLYASSSSCSTAFSMIDFCTWAGTTS